MMVSVATDFGLLSLVTPPPSPPLTPVDMFGLAEALATSSPWKNFHISHRAQRQVKKIWT